MQIIHLSFLPCCDEGTWENEKDGGTLVEEFETPVVDADLRTEDKQSCNVIVQQSDFYTYTEWGAQYSALNKIRCWSSKQNGAWYVINFRD